MAEKSGNGSISNLSTKAGALTVAGPTQLGDAAFVCSLGVECVLVLPGEGLAATNAVAIVNGPSCAAFGGFAAWAYVGSGGPAKE